MEDSLPGRSGPDADREKPSGDDRPGAKWLDIREAARCLQVSEKTIRRRIKAGKVRSQKISGVWFVALEDHPRLSDIPSPSPPPPAAPPSAPEPADDEKLDEIKDSIRHILKRLDEVDKKLYVLAEEREHVIASSSLNIRKMEQTVEQLTEENRRLREELRTASAQMQPAAAEDLRTAEEEPTPPPPGEAAQLPKLETGDTLELKAMLASNERGLNLLREEVEKKEGILQQKDRDIIRLENELRILKGKTA